MTMTTTDNPGLAEQVAAVLAAHRSFPNEVTSETLHCMCGAFAIDNDDMATRNWAAHLAAQLLPLIEAREQEAAAKAGSDDDRILEEVIAEVHYDVESKHHIHRTECLCGFKSAVARELTKHIVTETLISLGVEEATP